MRTIRYLFLAAIAIVLITMSLANNTAVTLNLLPEALVQMSGFELSITVPLFAVIFASIIAGLLIGFIWEYLREYKHRSEAAVHKKENVKLSREVEKMKVQKARDEGDEVLALLDKSSFKD